MASPKKKPDGRSFDDKRPGRLPLIQSSGAGLTWRCPVLAQPQAVRLVIRASPDGGIWASIARDERT